MAQLKDTKIEGILEIQGKDADGKSLILPEGSKIYIGESEFQGGGGSGDTNVQSDWNENTETSDAFIKNKPPIKNGNGNDSVVVGDGDALSNNSISLGVKSLAGGRAYTILGIEKNELMYYLDSVEGLEVGDVYSVHVLYEDGTSSQAENYGRITDISVHENTVTVNRFYCNKDFTTAENYLDENGIDTERNTFRIVSKPNIGNRVVGAHAFSEGYQTQALSKNAHAEGNENIAYGSHSHAEGSGNKAGYCSHAEGRNNQAIGQISHAEGRDNTAFGSNSHVEGANNTASHDNSHAEGNGTEALGKNSHAEGSGTDAEGKSAHAEGGITRAGGDYSHSEGYWTRADGQSSHAEGDGAIATGKNSHAEGRETSAGGTESHAEGHGTIALGDSSHAEGKGTRAIGTRAHAEGYRCIALGNDSHAEGLGATDLGNIPIDLNTATNEEIIAQWKNTKFNLAKGIRSHTEGINCMSLAQYAHSEGRECIASGNQSHAEGDSTIAAGDCQHVQGKYNIEDSKNDYAHIVGGGDANTPSNLHTIRWSNGQGFFKGGTTTEGADYAEFFEWIDGNPNNEDRVGLLVTLDGEKIKLANTGDEVLGIISRTAAVLGDNYECEWNGKYLTDDFGRVIYDLVEEFIDEEHIEFKEVEKEVIDEETNEVRIETKLEEVKTTEKKSLGFWKHPRINPDYDPEQKYINRLDRPEWDTVGMLGKLFVRDDGTCIPNFYATVSENGIATSSLEKTNMRVLSRVNNNVVRVLLK